LSRPILFRRIQGSNAIQCDTPECQLCASRMKQKLRDVGLMSELAPGLDFKNFTSASSQDYCQSYRFDHPKLPSNQMRSIDNSNSNEDAAVKCDVNRLIQMGQEYHQKRQKNATSSNGKPATGRGKRQTDNSTAILGEITVSRGKGVWSNCDAMQVHASTSAA
jgi:hypothetical protein